VNQFIDLATLKTYNPMEETLRATVLEAIPKATKADKPTKCKNTVKSATTNKQNSERE